MDINPLSATLKAISPMIPKKEPNNPVSQFLSDLMTHELKMSEETELLKTIMINVANNDPNAVVGYLIKIHNAIGDFITSLNVARAVAEGIEHDDDMVGNEEPDDV